MLSRATQTPLHRPSSSSIQSTYSSTGRQPLLTSQQLQAGHFYMAHCLRHTPSGTLSQPWRTVLISSLSPTRISILVLDHTLNFPSPAGAAAHRWVALQGSFVRPTQPLRAVEVDGGGLGVGGGFERYVCYTHTIVIRAPPATVHPAEEEAGEQSKLGQGAVENTTKVKDGFLPYLHALFDAYWRGERWDDEGRRYVPGAQCENLPASAVTISVAAAPAAPPDVKTKDGWVQRFIGRKVSVDSLRTLVSFSSSSLKATECRKLRKRNRPISTLLPPAPALRKGQRVRYVEVPPPLPAVDPFPKLRILVRHTSTQTDGLYDPANDGPSGHLPPPPTLPQRVTTVQDPFDDEEFGAALEQEMLGLMGVADEDEGGVWGRVWVELGPLRGGRTPAVSVMDSIEGNSGLGIEGMQMK